MVLRGVTCIEDIKDPGLPTDSFYEIRAGCTDVQETKFRIKNSKAVLNLQLITRTLRINPSLMIGFCKLSSKCLSFQLTQAGKTLSVKRWRASFTPEGSLDIGKCLNRICRGGIHPSIRGEVWEFLLGCYDPKSTYDEREQIRQRRRDQYAQLKESCSHMFPVVGSGKFITARVITADGDPIQDPTVLLGADLEQLPTPQSLESVDPIPVTVGSREHDKDKIQWKLALHQIGLDVVRTDRTLMFYEKQENLAKLWDVLAVYAWHDKDVGYGQGMSDLCSPMIMLLENEADAFWCFERLMRRVRGNFRCTGNSVGVEAQLDNLANVTKAVYPKLHQHLEHLGGGGYLFAFRMLMVLFRREYSFGDSLVLWEMMWSLEYDPELFSLYEGGETQNKYDVYKATRKSRRQYGKYIRANRKSRARARGEPGAPLPISVFVLASVLKDRSDKLLKEARGLDDVVKILNDISGSMDAQKACTGAMKIHKKYLKRYFHSLFVIVQAKTPKHSVNKLLSLLFVGMSFDDRFHIEFEQGSVGGNLLRVGH
ncbi:rab-GTPase-TBC domain-containing protein [Artemisia annua]|uniref:Rab-GTPase-TBC domain-containing protein n=1 Tax=Artemisia annua TaxID=35608 RepID=A0A2U1M5Y0_ARTAN|nr:rab-GTPase-TBC domain-containing protein [Artemisia annua]